MKNFINDQAFTDDLTELEDNDLILTRDLSNSKKNTQITFSNLKGLINGNVNNSILNGGINNIDEDLPQLIGGLNGTSKNSNTINNG